MLPSAAKPVCVCVDVKVIYSSYITPIVYKSVFPFLVVVALVCEILLFQNTRNGSTNTTKLKIYRCESKSSHSSCVHLLIVLAGF